MNLYVLTGKSAGEECVVHDELSIGRLPECGLTLHDQGVSRKHARLVRESAELYLEDLGSANGTKLRGQRVQKVRLDDGAVFAVGPVELRVRIELPAPSLGSAAAAASPVADGPVVDGPVADAPVVEARAPSPSSPSSQKPAVAPDVVAPISAKDDPHRLPSGVLRYSQPKRGGLHADDLSQRGPLQRYALLLVVLAVGALLAYMAFQVAS